MASPSASLGPTSFHPTLTLSLPQAFLQPSSSSSQCQPHLLLSLPPSLFLDPFHPSTSHFKHTARIQELHYLSATTEGNVEIEKAVGWTMDRKSVPRGKREKAQADAEEAEAQLVEKLEQTEVRFVAGEGYVTKTLSSSKEGPTQVVALPNDGASSSSAAGGRKKAPPNRENETILIRLAARDDGDASGSIKVPLHARYLPPVDNSSSSIAPLSLIKSVLKSSTDGNYLDVSPSAIEAFWVCPSGGSTAAPTDDLSEGGAIWEKVLRPPKLLPPSHVHLTSPLIDRLTPSSNKPSIHRLVNMDSTSSTTNRLPTGDAAFAGDAFTITQTVLALLAVWMFVRVRAMTKGE